MSGLESQNRIDPKHAEIPRESRSKNRRRKVTTEGEAANGFGSVKDVFIENFSGNLERDGAALAVYHKGALVVDLWGGVADRAAGSLWNRDTLASIVCCTKGIASICIAMMVDRGECSYSDKVVKFWPEFGSNNKQDITIEMILTHRAGMPYFDAEFNLNEITKDSMAKIIEAELPKYPPGSKTQYHAVTFGWLIDQIFSRIDKKHRTVGEFFREEVYGKYNVEVYIGCSEEQESRLAKFPQAKKGLVLREYIHDRKIFTIGAHLSKRPTVGVSRMQASNEIVDLFNNRDVRTIAQAALSGVATARGLARTFQLFMDGSLISNDLLQRISKPQYCNEFDHALGKEESKGYGFVYTKSSTGSWQIGHPAVGGQCVYMDPVNNVVVCYLTNGVKSWAGDYPLCFSNLQMKIYEAIANIGLQSSDVFINSPPVNKTHTT
uniref:Beta-lactamase domain-containing protein n=1 Tax=Haemonchus contortus TaxID=6289 RepID=A0A7I4Y4S5_HAECO